jgi:hypothetical protein
MSTFDPVQFLKSEADRIGPFFGQRYMKRTPWDPGILVKHDVFPEGMGNEITALTFERVLPSSDPTWTSRSYVIGSDSATCAPTAVKVPSAHTARTYKVYQTAIESEDICHRDIAITWNSAQQLEHYYKKLGENTAYAWRTRTRDDVYDVCERLIAIGSSSTSESSSAMPVLYGGKLTNSILEEFHLELTRTAADMSTDNSVGMLDGQPLYPIVIGAEASRALLRESEYRTDVRENAAMVPELLKPLGVSVNMLGFMHIVDLFPRRWDVVDGAWVERKPWTGTAATYGTKQGLNPDWKNAEYEDVVINPGAATKQLIPGMKAAPGGNTKVVPVDFTGKWEYKVILDRNTNPDGDIGFFRANLACAAFPNEPEHTIILRFKRCQSATFATCA